ncbi:MAG: DUF3379 family protein [Chromatiales bacterium]|jgi:hypothetical protein
MSAEHPVPPIDCREVRRRLLIDPRDPDPGLRRHREGCPACDRAANDALAFEARLRRALSVDPPPGLAGRVRRALGRRAAVRVGAAAAVVLGLGLAAWIGAGLTARPDLAGVVAGHIEAEAEHLSARQAVGAPQLAALVGELGGELTRGIGEVRFAGLCVIRDHYGIHLVVKGRHGPVTVLIMPGEDPGRDRSVSTGRLRGLILPTAYGSLAVVGEPQEPLHAWADEVRGALVWRS